MDVLIVVDMQEGPFGVRNKHDMDGVVTKINRLSDFIRNQGGRVIYIQHDGKAEEDLLPGSPGWNVLSILKRDDSDIVIRKTRNDSFTGTELEPTLHKLGASNILIAGWATDFCIDSTIRSAVSRGFKVFIPSDGHTVADRPHLKATDVIEHHNWIWANLIADTNPVTVMTTDELLVDRKLNTGVSSGPSAGATLLASATDLPR